MSDLQQRIEALEQKLQLRLPGSTFSRQLAEKVGDPINWVLGIGEMSRPKVFFADPSMEQCVALAERYVNSIANPGLHVTASFCGESYVADDFCELDADAPSV